MFPSFPRVYPILDSATLPHFGREDFLHQLGSSLTEAGVRILEYRNKTGRDEELLADGAILRAALPAQKIKLILDDRVDLVKIIEFDGVHVDAGDASPATARHQLGPGKIVGTFGGSDALIPGILSEPADYFAIGPVYSTSTKHTVKPPIGPEGVKRLRAEAGPDAVLVAVAGITLKTAALMLQAGASAVAVSAAIFRQADPAREFRRWLAELG